MAEAGSSYRKEREECPSGLVLGIIRPRARESGVLARLDGNRFGELSVMVVVGGMALFLHLVECSKAIDQVRVRRCDVEQAPYCFRFAGSGASGLRFKTLARATTYSPVDQWLNATS